MSILWLHYGVENPRWDTSILEHLQSYNDVNVSFANAKVCSLEDFTKLDSFTDEIGKKSSDTRDSTGKIRRPLLVNRVSDAQIPELAKFTSSVLQYVEDFLQWQTVNGFRTFNVAVSKALQSKVIQSLGLQEPLTKMVRVVDNTNAGTSGSNINSVALSVNTTAAPYYYPNRANNTAAASSTMASYTVGYNTIDHLRSACEEIGFPCLIKPNAGGFGKGIMKIESEDHLLEILCADDNSKKNDLLTSANDNVLLLQKFHPNSDFYRVWHLNGEILVATQVISNDPSNPSFNSCACAAGKDFIAFDPPQEVHEEIARICKCVDASMGSIEYLVPKDVPNDSGAGQNLSLAPPGSSPPSGLTPPSGPRLYFDINMLSTLPFADKIQYDSAELEEKYKDPHKKVAEFLRKKAFEVSNCSSKFLSKV